VPTLRTIMWRLAGNPHPVAPIDVVLARDGTPIAQPAGRVWLEAGRPLTPGTTVWLVSTP
jgi:hypothetical protein